jgi:hypothetical protein
MSQVRFLLAPEKIVAGYGLQVTGFKLGTWNMKLETFEIVL